MSALDSAHGRRKGSPGPRAFGLSSEAFVLPRWLRRPARLLTRLRDGDFAPPRFANAAMSGALLAAAGIYGTVLGGHTPAVVQAITARTGFAVDEIRVSGHHETSEIDIVEQLGLDGWTSLIGFDPDAARSRIAQLPWVQSAAVRKVYPDTIEVRVEERQAFAIWQRDHDLLFVEQDGDNIAPFSERARTALPLIVGDGAPKAAPGFIDKVQALPELAARVKGYVRVADRRWDIRLENGITVKLPQEGEDQALAELARIERESGLFSRDITSIDMRQSGRMVVQLSAAAIEKREAALIEQAKASKKPKQGKHT